MVDQEWAHLEGGSTCPEHHVACNTGTAGAWSGFVMCYGGSSCMEWAHAWRAARAQTWAIEAGVGERFEVPWAWCTCCISAKGLCVAEISLRSALRFRAMWGFSQWHSASCAISVRAERRKLSGRWNRCCFCALFFHCERRAYLSLSWWKSHHLIKSVNLLCSLPELPPSH